MGNLGDAVKIRYLDYIPVIICSNTDQEGKKAIFTGATYDQEYNFNVFSITNRLQIR